MALLYTKKALVREATVVRQTFSSFGGRPRFRGLCSWALLRHLEPLSAEPEVTLFFPSPMFFFTFPSDRLSLRFSSPEFGLLLSSLELRRFLSSAEVWDDVCKFNNNNDDHYNSHYQHWRCSALGTSVNCLHSHPEKQDPCSPLFALEKQLKKKKKIMSLVYSPKARRWLCS